MAEPQLGSMSQVVYQLGFGIFGAWFIFLAASAIWQGRTIAGVEVKRSPIKFWIITGLPGLRRSDL